MSNTYLPVHLVAAKIDIVDKDLKAVRNAKWEKAFQKTREMTKVDIDRKATIVIEHLIQASDVAHTMQHWQVR